MLIDNQFAPLILIVVADDDHAALIRRSFEESADQYVLKRVSTLHEARAVIDSTVPGLVLADYQLPDGGGRELLTISNSHYPVILMASQGHVHLAVDAIKAGAQNYVVKSPETFFSMASIVKTGLLEWKLVPERKLIFESISRGKLELEQTFDAVPDLIAIIDNQCTITRVNRAMAERYGFKPKEIVGRKCYEVMHGQTIPADFCQRSVLMECVMQYRYEMNEPNLDGAFDVTVTPLLAEGGQSVATVYVAREITERKNQEDAFQISEQKLKAILDASTAGIVSIRPNGAITFFNNRVPEMFGYSSAELMSLPYDSLIHLDQRDLGVTYLHSLITGKISSITTERHYLRKDGSSFWGYLSARNLLDADGKPTAMLATITDITDIKETRVALLNNSELLRMALEACTDGIWDWDTTTGFVLWSPRCFEMLGYEPNEFVVTADKWKELLHPDDTEAVIQSMKEQISIGEGNFTVEYRIADKSGGWHWVQERGKPVSRDEEGHILRIVGTQTDLQKKKREENERQLFEQKLQQTQRLESLGVLAGGIAHDFNNILTIILGHCYVCMDEIDSKVTVKSHLQQIENAANRASDLCRQMLAYAGKNAQNQVKVNLWLLVNDIVKMLQSALSKNVTIKLELMSDVPEICADASQIQQVVMNLIINAAEAIGDNNGTIKVALQKVSLPVGCSDKDFIGNPIVAGGYAVLQVSDDGCGMSQETQQRIFEPFFSSKSAGRGLGMSAVLGIIKSHNGAITLTSFPGGGTTFKVYFPLQNTTEIVATQDSPPLAWPSLMINANGTILLVEDEEALRTIVTALLDSMGFNVICVSNGREALDAFAASVSEFDLIILDLNMPEMGGVEAYHRLRTISASIPILMTSGYDLDLSQWGIEKDPYLFTLKKPYNPEFLKNLLTTLLDQQGE